jgi:hypothetical protein
MAGQAKAMTAVVEELPKQQQLVQVSATGDSPDAEVALAAYYLWRNRGCPIGSDQEKLVSCRGRAQENLCPGAKQIVGLAAAPESATIRIRQNCSI